jgi:L-histidine N-alpha-methyltransferase
MIIFQGEDVKAITRHDRTKQQEFESALVHEFASDLVAGLSSPRKYIASKYFYDEAGSRLFEQICLVPEYYLTRAEAAILKGHSSKIARSIIQQDLNTDGNSDIGISVIELGSGSSTKTRILLDQMRTVIDRIHYFPIDISHKMLQETTQQLKSAFPNISTLGIPMDYSSGIEEVSKIINENPYTIPQKKLIIFLGSSMGNFEPEQVVSFLRMLRQRLSLESDYLLIGFDLQKDSKVITAAYNDSQGVTAKFNLNLLARINKELDGNFDLDRFAHKAFYNKRSHRIEMHLVSAIDQDVYIGAVDRSFNFKKNETIHTENSYKYNLHQIRQIAGQCGFIVSANFTDRRKRFALSLLRPMN